MTARAYYNEFEPYAVQWLRNLISDGVIPPGDVDERSIVDVQPEDLNGYTQCHFFAGIAGWGYALRLAGWSDARPIWTGSCPCQPFSVAGKGAGKDDPRHLWPNFFRLIEARRPPIVLGEQVAGAAGYDWFDGVAADLEREGYACRAVDIPAAAVDAPHIRQRLYWVAVGNADGAGLAIGQNAESAGRRLRDEGTPAFSPSIRNGNMADARSPERGAAAEGRRYVDDGADAGRKETASRYTMDRSAWSDAEWLTGADGKARRVKSGVRLLDAGIPARASKLRAYGNAIVPQIAAEVIAAFMECAP